MHVSHQYTNTLIQATIINDQFGDNPLHLAVQQKDTRAVTLLLRYHADPALENIEGKTPLDVAKENKDEDMIELLSEQSLLAFGIFQGMTTFRSEGIDSMTKTELSSMQEANSELKEEDSTLAVCESVLSDHMTH